MRGDEARNAERAFRPRAILDHHRVTPAFAEGVREDNRRSIVCAAWRKGHNHSHLALRPGRATLFGARRRRATEGRKNDQPTKPAQHDELPILRAASAVYGPLPAAREIHWRRRPAPSDR